MKKGYVVCNITNYSDTPEIFGVYSNLKTVATVIALLHLRKTMEIDNG